jgi:hypothetical protein
VRALGRFCTNLIILAKHVRNGHFSGNVLARDVYSVKLGANVVQMGCKGGISRRNRRIGERE